MNTINSQNTKSNAQTPAEAVKVLDFWFDEKNSEFWFKKDNAFDAEISEKFGDIWESARSGEFSDWRVTAEGALAEIIVLDQFSRNLCRNSAEAFAQDDMALALAQEAIKREDYSQLPKEYQRFVLMPFMHSESKSIHEKAVVLFEELGDESTLKFELMHKDIIDRFGRYPHRNNVLDRESTDEEIEFLQQPNSSF